jgi:curli biogenesis system outer membrane secretion channel CsgG
LTPTEGDRIVTVSEAQRRRLHAELVKKLGADVADTLMEHLPQAGWSDLARRSDLDALESRLEAKIANTAASQMRWFMASQLVLVVATIGSITTIAH